MVWVDARLSVCPLCYSVRRFDFYPNFQRNHLNGGHNNGVNSPESTLKWHIFFPFFSLLFPICGFTTSRNVFLVLTWGILIDLVVFAIQYTRFLDISTISDITCLEKGRFVQSAFHVATCKWLRFGQASEVCWSSNVSSEPCDTTKVMPTRKRALRTCLAIIPTQRLIWEIHINPTQCWKIDFVKRSILATFKHSSDQKMSPDKYLRFWTLRWNPKVWPLKWKLSMSTF